MVYNVVLALLYSKVNQLYAYKYPHFFSPFLGCAVQHEDLSFPDQGPNPALGGQSLNQWTIREAPLFHSFKTPLISCYSLRNPPQLSEACINMYIQLYEFRTSFWINLICFLTAILIPVHFCRFCFLG